MTRRSLIDTHPDSAKIIEMISTGVPAVEINARYPNVSVYAISRYKIKRNNVLSGIVEAESEADASDVIGRILDLADSARVARRLADLSATPAVRARVVAAELAVLDRLVTRLGVDDLVIARQAQAAKPLVQTLKRVAKDHPVSVLDALSMYPELADLHAAIKLALKREGRKK